DAGYAGVAGTISALTGRWATDPVYGEKLAGRGNDQLVRHRISAAYQSSNSVSAWLADDANAGTAWQSTATYPSLAVATYDLGTVRSLGLVRWMFQESGYADAMRVELSSDGVSWRTLVSAGNGPRLQWQGLMLNSSARYVRFVVTNPYRDLKLGSLAEVQFWPPTTAPLPFTTWQAPSPAMAPTPVVSPSATPFPTATTVAAPPTGTSASRTIRGGGEGAPTAPPAPTATSIAPVPNTPAATSPSVPTATPASRSIRR
ncbi:MAG TPA: discoidin domain-containing protein, partial [Thermomicrobiales bacterium]|nr:discoidin domain-containing protein [Thermomicrobiales bacterium]